MRGEGGNYWREEERTEEGGKGERKVQRGKQAQKTKGNGERGNGEMKGGKQIIPHW